MIEKLFYLAQFIEYIPLIEKAYRNNLRIHFATYMPLISSEETEIMCAKPVLLTEKRLNCDYMIEQLIEAANCNKRKYFSRIEQISVLETLIEAAENMLYYYVKENSRENLFMLQQMLEYNFHLSMIFINRNSDTFVSEEIGEPFFKEVIGTLEFIERFRMSINLDNINVDINNLLANDKQAIQKAISFIVNNMPEEINIKTKEKLEIDFQEEKVKEILNIARALYKILQILDMVSTEKKCVLKIKKTGIDIEVKRGFQKTNLEQIERMIMNSNGKTDEKWLEQYDEYIRAEFGLSFSEIEKFAEQLASDIGGDFEYRIFDEESICEVFAFGSHSKEELEKFCLYFVLDKSYKANSAFDSEKCARKPIIRYGEGIYGVSLIMFSIGITILLADIKTGTTGSELFNRKIQKDISKNRELFEREVAEAIVEVYPESKVIQPVEKIAGVTPPEEMDVICFYQGFAYVIECKATDLKYTIKEEMNFLKNFTKDSKNSFIAKLDRKIEFLYENLDALKAELNERSIEGIKGVFVLKYPTEALNFQESKFPIIHISQLGDILAGDLGSMASDR